MTKKKQTIRLLILFFMLLIIGYLGENLNINHKEIDESKEHKNIRSSGYWVLDFIHIDGNWTQTNSTYDWCSGSGTEIDPYLIENVTIDGQNSSSCIIIENTDEYFEIRNCTIFNSAGAGIELNNVSNSKIIGNNCSNNSFGISLHFNSISNTISANFINNNSQYGIILNYVQNISGPMLIIFNNTIIWNNVNAYDSGTNTDWDNGVIGNYWSDYDGVDDDNDGIGDTPYTIPGPSGKQDNFPLYDRYFVPSIEDYVPPDQIIKVGILGDPNHISCEHTSKGAFLAAKEINEAGGILINGSVFYIGLISQNTFEAEENLDITKGIDAATNLISTYDPDFIIGGLNYNSVSAYLEPIMDAQIPFLPTIVSIDNFTQNVLDNYTRYKYFFSHMHNNTEVARELITFQAYLTSILSSPIYLSRSVNKIAILHDGLGLWPQFCEWVKTNFLPMYGLEIVKEIIFNQSTTKDNFKDYWYEIDNAGAQLTFVGSYTLDNLPLISEAYGEAKPRCLLFSSNIYTALDTYWNDTFGGCKYEVSFQGIFNVSRTSRSIPFWNNFVNEYSHEPFHAAASAYDSIYLLVNATLDSQSLSASKIVGSLEKINVSNPFPGISGKFAYTSSHAVFQGVGYGAEGYTSGIMSQWQSGGTKVVIPNGNLIYPDSLATGSLEIPDWGINIHYTINSPNENDIFTELPPAFNVEILDPIVDSWYTLNSGSEKHFFTINESIDPTAWNNLPEGIVNITFYANDSQGKIYRRYVSIIKDVSPPQVTIEPMETTTFGSEAPTITLDIQDASGIKESYYSLDGGLTKIPFTGNVVTINQSIWDALGQGTVTIAFYIIDAVDKETIVYVDVYKDLNGEPSPLVDNLFFFIIIGAIALCLGIVSTITYTQHRRKKRRKTEWLKLKKKKGLISPELAEGKNLIFISYATKDSDLFQIPLITDILVQYPEVDDILYWESDMHDDIYEYMDDNLKLCSVFLLFCTQNSLYSEPVKMEWRSALKLDKKVIPIFINPNDIPPLLTTKLGMQYDESEVYYSIEKIYQMILKKLEITSTREFCNYLIPKEVSEEYFEEKTAPMFKRDIEIESDLTTDDLQIQLIPILEKNNFQSLKKPSIGEETKKTETTLIFLRFFVEDKFEKQEIGLSATIQKVEDNQSKLYLRVMGKKEWMINEIIRDLDKKCYALKTVTELLRGYSEKIEDFLDQIENLDEFLRTNLGAEIKKIEESVHQYSNKKIEKGEFIKNGIQLLGKRFILFFIENLPKFPDEKKKPEEKDEEPDAPILF